MEGRKTAVGAILRRVAPVSIAATLVLALCLPQAGFSSEAAENNDQSQATKTVPLTNEAGGNQAPQVSQQVPLDVEAPQLVGMLPMEPEEGARQGEGVGALASTDESGSTESNAQIVKVTFRIDDEPTASWPDAREAEATAAQVVGVEPGKALGDLVPSTPVSADETLAFQGWQTEDFAHTYTAEELREAMFSQDTTLYAVFTSPSQKAESKPRETNGWTKFGTCEWQINDMGTLYIRPENNAATGQLQGTSVSSYPPWTAQADRIKSAIVQTGVKASYNQVGLFRGCSSMTSVTFLEDLGTEVRNVSEMFYGCSSLNSLTLPKSFGANIENASSMFGGCSALSSVQMTTGFAPNIKNASQMFKGCSSLTSLTLPSDFGSNVTTMSSMFEDCSSLASVSLPQNFGENASSLLYLFRNCVKLNSLVLPSGFGSQAESLSGVFFSCSGLSSLNLPERFGSVATSIDSAFDGCSGLTTLKLPAGFGSKASSVFYLFRGCSSLTSMTLPEGCCAAVTDGTGSMFQGCTNLVSVTIPESSASGFTSGDMEFMFEGCSSLTTLSLPSTFCVKSNCTSSMFEGCSSLASVDLPVGFGSEADYMDRTFYGCTSLRKVPDNFAFGKNTSYNSECFYVETDTSELFPTLYAGSDPSVTSYDWEADGRTLNPTLSESLTADGVSASLVVEGAAFANQKLNATASLPSFASAAYQWYVADSSDGVKSKVGNATTPALDLSTLDAATIVGKYLFCEVSDGAGWYKGSLSSEAIGPVGIAKGASGTCTWTINYEGGFELAASEGYSGTLDELSSASVPWSQWKTQMTSVTVQSGVQGNVSLDSMFAGCSNVAWVMLPADLDFNVNSAKNMFAGCSKLASLTLPNDFCSGVSDVSSMFADCTALSSLTLGENFCSRTSDMSSLFKGCSSLSSLTLPSWFGDEVDNVSAMFKECTALRSLKLPDGMADYASNMESMFEGCSHLSTLELPAGFGSSYTENMASLFKGCELLSSLVLPDGFGGDAKNISSMFENCIRLTSITLPDSFDGAAENASSLFKNCTSLSTLTVGSFFGSNETNLSSMFEGCSALRSETFSSSSFESFGFNAADASYLFKGCRTLSSLTIPGAFTSATNMAGMFEGCSNLSALTLPDGFTTSATNMNSMFANCTSLTKIPATFTFGSTTAATRKGCFALSSPYSSSNLLKTFYAGTDPAMDTYNWASDFRVLNPSLAGTVKVSGSLYANQTVAATVTSLTSGVTPAYQWYVADTPTSTKTKISGATSASLNLALVDASKVVGKRLFCAVSDASGLYTTSIWSAATSPVNIACGTSGSNTTGCAWTIDYQGAFALAPITGSLGTLGELAWNNVPWSAWATQIKSATVRSGVAAGKSLQSMFSGCSAMTAVDLSGLSTPQTADMLSMFSGCLALKKVDGLSGLRSSRTEQMFQGCRELPSVTLAGFDTSGVTSMTSMFSGCSKLSSLDLSKQSTAKATGLDSMFKGCTLLASLTLPDGFVGATCTTVVSMFEGCNALTTVPANFSFGPSNSSVNTNRCFYVGSPYTSSKPLSTTYLGDDERVAAYGWAASNRKLVDWNLKGSVKLSVEGDVWRQGSTASASAQFKAPATGLQPSFQWRRSANADGSAAKDIAGATKATYELGADDVGSYLVCAVSVPGSGARGEVLAVSKQPVSAAQISVTVPSVTSVAVSPTGQMAVPDASVYALGNPSGGGGSTGAIRLKSVKLTLHQGYPGGVWTLGTKSDPDAYVSSASFVVAPGATYSVSGSPVVPVGGTMPLQWDADMTGVGPQLAKLLGDAQAPGGAAYGSVEFTVEYAPEG